MNNINFEDCYYTAMRQMLKISRKKLDDLHKEGICQSHRDIADMDLIETNAKDKGSREAKELIRELKKRSDDIRRLCDDYIERAVKGRSGLSL